MGIQTIMTLVQYLPKDDIIIANNFIAIRDFESLKELVDSAIIRVKKNLRGVAPKEEYVNINMDKLITLKSEVDSYVEQLIIPTQGFFMNIIEEEGFNEEY